MSDLDLREKRSSCAWDFNIPIRAGESRPNAHPRFAAWDQAALAQRARLMLVRTSAGRPRASSMSNQNVSRDRRERVFLIECLGRPAEVRHEHGGDARCASAVPDSQAAKRGCACRRLFSRQDRNVEIHAHEDRFSRRSRSDILRTGMKNR